MALRTYRVSEVARIARVSVRTLHHYDSIGLLVPSSRTVAAYRLYSDSDLLRLQQIMIWRELGLALEEIRRVLDDPALDRRKLLTHQRAQLVERVRSTQAMLRSIDAALTMLDPQQIPRVSTVAVKQLFAGFDPAEYQQEVRARWGNSDAYRESARRTARYSAEDWRAIKMQWDEIMTAAADALQQQVRPADEAAMDLAE